MAKYGWGIIGPGNIVKRMMTALPHPFHVPVSMEARGNRDRVVVLSKGAHHNRDRRRGIKVS